MTAPSPVVPFTTATAVRKVTSNSWTATLIQDYCVGAVPNGGYVGSVLHQVVSQHLSAQGQRQDIISAQLQYLNRTQVGEATIVVEDVKRGRATSTIHATLLQQQGSSPAAEQRKCILAYFVCAAPSPDGLTLATGWTLHPPPPPVDLDRVAEGLDPNWSSTAGRVQTSHLDAVGFVRHVERVLESFYRRKPARKGLDDVWLRLTTGERFTNATLPLVADAKPYVVERWRPPPAEEEAGPFPSKEAFWYPTLVMNLDIKKLLPPEGVEWLFLRTEARMIDQGRLDLQVYILDQHGDLIALASHINLIVSAARNLGTKGGKGRL